MSKFDLQKKAEVIDRFLLAKGVAKAPIMRVGAALDISGSMDMDTRRPETTRIISSGKLQKALNQLMGAAMRFDDNGELDVFKFDTMCEYVGTATPSNYENYISKQGIRARGGTAYSPIVAAAQKFFFGGGAPAQPAKKRLFGFGGSTPAVPATGGDNTPVLMLVITDGEISQSDRAETNAQLQRAESTPIYYHYVGVGGTRKDFPSIAFLADERPNVGEVYLPSFDLSDDEVYAQLICPELIEFIAKFANAGSSAASA